MSTVDLEVINELFGWLVTPHTSAGEDWLEVNVHYENWQIVGQSIAVDGARHAFDIAVAATADGLKVTFEGLPVTTDLEVAL